MPCLSPSWASHNASIIASGEKCLITFQTHRQTSSLSRTGKTSISYSNDQQPKKTSTENLHTFHKNQRNHVWFECDIALTANEVEKKNSKLPDTIKNSNFWLLFLSEKLKFFLRESNPRGLTYIRLRESSASNAMDCCGRQKNVQFAFGNRRRKTPLEAARRVSFFHVFVWRQKKKNQKSNEWMNGKKEINKTHFGSRST